MKATLLELRRQFGPNPDLAPNDLGLAVEDPSSPYRVLDTDGKIQAEALAGKAYREGKSSIS